MISRPKAIFRIAVVDDNETVRQLLCEALRLHLDFEIVCEASDGAGAIECAETTRPDVFVLDISLPDSNGVELVKRIRDIAPFTRVLLCSQHHLEGMVRAGFRAGALGYLLKSDAIAELAIAVRTIGLGRQYLSKNLAGEF